MERINRTLGVVNDLRGEFEHGLTAEASPGLDRPVFTRDEVPRLATAITLLASTSIAVILLGAVAGQMQQALAFDDRALGAGAGLFWMVSALSAPWGGRLADRWGWRSSARLSALLAMVPLLGIPTVATGLGQLVGLLLVAGIAHGLGSPAGNVALSTIRRRRRGLAFGMKQAAVPLVSAGAGLAVPLVALTVGWRWVFTLAAPLPLLAICFIGRRDVVSAISPTLARTETDPDYRPAHPRLLWAEAVAGGLGTLSSGVMTTFTVRTLTESGFSVGDAGLLFAVAGAGSLCMRLAAGWWADRRRVDTTRQVVWFLLIGAIGMGLLATGRSVPAGIGAVLALAWGWSWVALFLLRAVSREEAAAGATTGTLQLGLAGGAAVGPLLFGLLLGLTGFGVAWNVIAGCSVLSAGLLTWSQRQRRKATG